MNLMKGARHRCSIHAFRPAVQGSNPGTRDFLAIEISNVAQEVDGNRPPPNKKKIGVTTQMANVVITF